MAGNTTHREIYRKQNIAGSKSFTFGNNNEYTITIVSYRVGTPEDHYWNFTRAIIHRAGTRKALFVIDRNYSSFFWEYIASHPKTKHDYLIVSRDYHGGYSVLNLTTGEEKRYTPEREYTHQEFFCWVCPKWDSGSGTIVVEGCYWACPFEEWTFDFSNPDVFPLPKISEALTKGEEDE